MGAVGGYGQMVSPHILYLCLAWAVPVLVHTRDTTEQGKITSAQLHPIVPQSLMPDSGTLHGYLVREEKCRAIQTPGNPLPSPHGLV